MRPIAERTIELAELHAEIFGWLSASGTHAVTAQHVANIDGNMHLAVDCTDDELVETACRAANGAKFARLYAGVWRSDYESQSQADLALCAMLSFWTRGDPDRIDRLFRRSGLMREKWHRHDYRKRTIEHAIASTSQGYQTCVDVQCDPVPVRLESSM